MVDVLTAPQQTKADSALRTLTGISVAHWLSHFHLFVLPMLFPFLKTQLGVGYIELGFALTVFAVVSGLTQAPIGYLADHIGARKILLSGLCLGGFALIMLGMHLSYPCADRRSRAARPRQQRLSPGGLRDPVGAYGRGADGPRVFDPHLCRLPRRRGGASDHGRAGGMDRRPRRADGGRRGRPAGGAACWSSSAFPMPARARTRPKGEQAPQASVITPAIIVLTIFFMLLSLSNAGIGNFGVVALMSGYGVSFSAANIALTAFLGASAAGVLAGGYLADRTQRHGQVAAACFAINAAIVLVIAAVDLPADRADRGDGACRLPRRRDRALARHAGAQRGASRRGGPRVRHRLHRLQSQRHRQSRCCSAGSWTRTCRIGCSAPPSCSWC